jgi:hypothetical protein
MENRRQFARAHFHEAVEYQRHEQSSLSGAAAGDISGGGLRLSVNEFIALNTVLDLQIHFPSKGHIVPVKGKVVWVREMPYRDDGWYIGVQFVSDLPSFN